MQTFELTVPPAAAGERLDRWLCAALAALPDPPVLSRSAVQALAEQGAVLVGGAPAGKKYRLAAGERVTLTLPDPQPIDAQPQDIPLNIVYEDEHLLVIDKPRGMVVHPAPGNPDGTLVNALLWHCAGQLSGVGGALRPGIVHRIDKDTSGLLVAAKNDAAHQALSAQLADHTLHRVYRAVVHGGMPAESGTVDAPIGRDTRDRKRMAVTANGKPAVTDWQLLEQLGQFSYIECRLHTGRTHQIRVHMAHLGHPLAGDVLYGPRRPALPGGQCLHARELGFIHPASGQPMHFTAPLPPYFTDFLDRLRKDLAL